jgi:hypothetical protein
MSSPPSSSTAPDPVDHSNPQPTPASAPTIPLFSPSSVSPPDDSHKRVSDFSSSSAAKRSRWGSKPLIPSLSSESSNSLDSSVSLPSFSPSPVSFSSSLPFSPSSDSIEFSHVQSRISLLTEMLSSNDSTLLLTFSGADRSPSPEPVYDPITGQRTNTREQRIRKKTENERNELILRALQVNPLYKPPVGWKRVNSQYSYQKKILIPVDQHPNYNFRGQIIGPRGSTQQKLEKELQCKILIRGKGSVPEGKSGRSNGAAALSAHEPLHVLIQADSQDKVENAERVIYKLLVPVDDRLNEHKTQQLRELALWNGTLRDEIICRKCGKSGHKMFECPLKESNWQAAQVKCANCGSNNHITTDCKYGAEGGKMGALENRRDKELGNFIDSLRGEDFIPSQTNSNGKTLMIEGRTDEQSEQQGKLFIHPARQLANGLNATTGHNAESQQMKSQSVEHSNNSGSSDGVRLHSFEGRDAAREFRPYHQRNHYNKRENKYPSNPPSHSSSLPYSAPPASLPSSYFPPGFQPPPVFHVNQHIPESSSVNIPGYSLPFDPSVPPPPLPSALSSQSTSSYPPRQYP